MTHSEVLDAVRDAVKSELRPDQAGKLEVNDDTDLFSLGLDSLQSSHVRARLVRDVDLGGHPLATNAVFEHPTIRLLARHMLDVRSGRASRTQSREIVARALVHKYSQFGPIQMGEQFAREERVVLLTGATGFIGRHVLACLLSNKKVTHVYCLVRGASDAVATSRVANGLVNALLFNMHQLPKMTVLACNLGDARLGLSASRYEEIRTSVTTVIHAAWAVNFNMKLESFESQCIAGTHNLLSLAMKSPLRLKPKFLFISSVASVMRARSTPIREVRHPWAAALTLGYGQSKWVAEEICAAAGEQSRMAVHIVRVGQVAGDTRHGIWNLSEAIPRTIESALTTGALPEVPEQEQDQYWLPVNIAGQAIVELAFSERVTSPPPSTVAYFHVCNTRPLRWNTEFLPALAAHGLRFDAVPGPEWVKRLEMSDPDVERNPPYRLLDFFRQRYGDGEGSLGAAAATGAAAGAGAAAAAATSHGLGTDLVGIKLGGYDVEEAQRNSSALRGCYPIDEPLIRKFLRYWTEDGWSSVVPAGREEDDPRGGGPRPGRLERRDSGYVPVEAPMSNGMNPWADTGELWW